MPVVDVVVIGAGPAGENVADHDLGAVAGAALHANGYERAASA